MMQEQVYVDERQMYINPVNCMMYMIGRMDESYEVELTIPDDYQIACQLPVKGKKLEAKNFDELADSPFIASATIQHELFSIDPN